jgi:hypothetical protein
LFFIDIFYLFVVTHQCAWVGPPRKAWQGTATYRQWLKDRPTSGLPGVVKKETRRSKEIKQKERKHKKQKVKQTKTTTTMQMAPAGKAPAQAPTGQLIVTKFLALCQSQLELDFEDIKDLTKSAIQQLAAQLGLNAFAHVVIWKKLPFTCK